jgi:predicted transposase YbfD/YdcC
MCIMSVQHKGITMILNLNQDVSNWLDNIRGEKSRQTMITAMLRKIMLETNQNLKDIKGNDKENITNGVVGHLP